MKKLRIMTFNVGYLTGITGRKSEYFLKLNRFIHTGKRIKETVSKKLSEIVKKEDPDILFLSEIKDDPCTAEIKKSFSTSCIDCKYAPKSMLNRLPLFAGNSNGIFMKETFPAKSIFLKNGTKKLVYRVDIGEELSLLFAHFALDKKTRKRQFAEIADIAAGMKNLIVAGDFNVFGGFAELTELQNKANLRIINKPCDKTFPCCDPCHAIDLFLASPSIKVTSLRVLGDIMISDHLPVIADIQY